MTSTIETVRAMLHETLWVTSAYEHMARQALYEFHLYGLDVCLAFAEAYTQKDDPWRVHTSPRPCQPH